MPANFNPGPWIVRRDAVETVGKYKRHAIESADGMWTAEVCAGLPQVTQDDNARLIAAAPELLEALRGLLHRAHPAHVADQYLRQALIDAREVAHAAIAKAEGQQ